ncbi:MAG: hypothetical protein M5U28_36060 [Sandaracinaceae bacterium]|nr:hypothetical protein [Sandaracinaceae bacterium]
MSAEDDLERSALLPIEAGAVLVRRQLLTFDRDCAAARAAGGVEAEIALLLRMRAAALEVCDG